MPDLSRLVKSLTADDDRTRRAASITLMRMDEMAVDSLIDQLYAGVDERTGLAIITHVAMIGGYEACLLLDDLAAYPLRYASWQSLAQQLLPKN